MGAFSDKFSISCSGETNDRIEKKLGMCNNGTDQLYHHANYGGNRASHAGCRQKSMMFLFFLKFVTLSNYEVCDNGNAIKQCNFKTSLVL